MGIQDRIVAVLKEAESAHRAAAETIASLRADNAVLTEDNAELATKLSELQLQVDNLKTESLKIVDPDLLAPLLAALAQVIADWQQIEDFEPHSQTDGPVPVAVPAADKRPVIVAGERKRSYVVWRSSRSA